MIKFFRKIRHKMLSERKLQNYLLYAFGEVALIIIGILLALQLNNWNEQQKNNLAMKVTLGNLKAEFEENIASINEELESLSNNQASNLYLLSLFGNDSITIPSTTLDSIIEVTVLYELWTPNRDVLDELTNSEKFSLIKDDGLKRLINDWKRQYEGCIAWNRRVEKSSQGIIEYLKENGSIRNLNHFRLGISKSKIKVNHYSLLNDLVFENKVDEKVLFAKFQYGYYENIKEIMVKIVEVVD